MVLENSEQNYNLPRFFHFHGLSGFAFFIFWHLEVLTDSCFIITDTQFDVARFLKMTGAIYRNRFRLKIIRFLDFLCNNQDRGLNQYEWSTYIRLTSAINRTTEIKYRAIDSLLHSYILFCFTTLNMTQVNQ